MIRRLIPCPLKQCAIIVHWNSNTKAGGIISKTQVYLRGAADRLYASLSASPRFRRAGLSPSIPVDQSNNQSENVGSTYSSFIWLKPLFS